jgi:hypothetical protein
VDALTALVVRLVGAFHDHDSQGRKQSSIAVPPAPSQVFRDYLRTVSSLLTL